ncbi:MAG: 7-cyano-7-deazaguanine synthase QueC [Gammaproteobacteria bacterium]
MAQQAIVLLSGGLDSATALAIAKSQGYECTALSFSYGQRSTIETEAARHVCQSMQIKRHQIIHLDLAELGGSALTDSDLAIPHSLAKENEIPITYVPARNTIFLSIALAWAEVLQAWHIFIGANNVDYSNYPDCRPEYIAAFEKMANLATKATVEGQTIRIETPLMNLGKADIIRRGVSLGVNYSLTISCYHADTQGRACKKCSSCQQRFQGFIQANIPDPTRYQSN